VAGETFSPRLGGLALAPDRLPIVHPDDFVQADGRPTPSYREKLRRIPNIRNAISVVSVYVQTIGVIALALWISSPFVWVIAFILMGRAHAQFASLMHESAHRLLFSHKKLNDIVGNWLLGYPTMTSTPAYRRVHMAHHREEFGPEEPDIALYANYPITQTSMRRKLFRDATGQTGIRLLTEQLRGFRSPNERVRKTLWKMTAVQVVLLGISIAAGYPLVYPLMWVLPYLTVWRVINRLRSIAEHGGLRADSDRRITTHSVHQNLFARFFLVPFNIGWHLAHHVDAGIPFRNLPAYHRHLQKSGYVTEAIEYPNYRSLWRACTGRS
jgi:fatty acid desaturase